MEPRAGAPQALSATTRVRVTVGCLLLVGLALVQDPGFVVPDTKFDLVQAPVDFLGRALHLWDAEGAFGQLQNQAYGYLWPMGPFFALGWLAPLPAWLVQRLWLGLVMSVAFAGCVKLAKSLGVRSDLACLVAAAAYALSPRMLTTLGPISIEAWPSALAPWVLVPLVLGATRGSARLAAAAAGLAVAMVGGVNAAATFAVVPLGVLWLLTRTPGPRRRALMLWWPVCTVLGTLWWLVPLFLMGGYSPPFLDFIETSSVTTIPTTVWDVLRGTSNWVPYVDPSSRAGNDLITTSYLVLNSAVVLLLGVAGLAHRRTPHRAFLGLAVVVGALAVGAGHQGSTAGWFAGDVASLLDGALSPLRNVHKFDPILRLPLVLGLAFFLERAVATWHAEPEATEDAGEPRQPVADRVNVVVLVGLALLAVVGASLPAVQGRLTPAGGFLAVPGYWSQTARWLDENSADRTALLVPGSTFAAYVWGDPRDEPLQYLGDSPWAVRNVIPLAPPGNIRMLDEVEDRLVQGDGSPGLAALLARSGVGHLVVRNDLARGDDVPDPVLVHQALADSGLERVARFGPVVGGGPRLETSDGQRVFVNDGWQAAYPAVEVFEVPDDPARASAATGVSVVAGGPEDLADLVDLGVLGEDTPTVLATDVGDLEDRLDPAGSGVVLTDGLRDRERFFARIHDGRSPVRVPGDVRRTGNPVRDYLPAGAGRWSSRGELDGVASLAASSSRSDAVALGGSVRGALPYAALDASAESQWVSGLGRTDRAWWRLGLTEPRLVSEVVLTGGADAPENQVVQVRTEAGDSEVVDLGPGEQRTVALPDGAETDWFEVREASPSLGRVLALADVSVEGVEASKALRLPSLPESWGSPRAVVLRSDLDARKGCVVVGTVVRCAPGRDRVDEEQTMTRVVDLPVERTWDTDLRVRPVGGPALDALVLGDQLVAVEGSSVAVPDPRSSPVAAIDGDPTTAWVADPDDTNPTLELRWLGRQRITGLVLSLGEDTAARRPLRLRVDGPENSRVVDLTDGVRAQFPALNTDRVSIQVLESDDAVSLDFDAQPQEVGVGIRSLRLRGLDLLPAVPTTAVRDLGCGSGPDLQVDGTTWRTAVQASSAQLARGEDVPARLCGPASTDGAPTETSAPLELGPGEHVLSSDPSDAFAVSSLVLTDPTAPQADVSSSAAGETGTAVHRELRPGDDDEVLVLHQNVNPGWHAEQDGERLAPVTVDGWQQGWLLGDGAGAVRADFAPDRAYRVGLVAGSVVMLGLVAAVLLGILRGRRRASRDQAPPLADRALSPLLAVPVVLVGGGLVAGFPGLLVGVAALVLAWSLARWDDLRAWVLAVPFLVVGAAYAVRPWGDPSGWAGNWAWTGYLALVPLLGVVAAAGADALRERWAKDSAGSSTSR